MLSCVAVGPDIATLSISGGSGLRLMQFHRIVNG